MDILENLRRELPNLPKKLALAARYALDAPDKIALNSMRTSALEVGVTSTTMLRLARQMGFESYEDFKGSFQSQLVATGFGARAGALHFQNSEQGMGLAQKIRAASEQNISNALDDANLKDLSEVAHLIRNATTVYLVATGSGFWVANIMKTTGSMILPNLRLVGTEYAIAAEGLNQVRKDDVVIGFGMNPCAIRTIDALQFVQEKGAQTIAITDRLSSPLVEYARYSFFSNTQSPHYYPSIIAMVAIVETLLATIVAEGGETELQRVREMEAHRVASNFYFEY